MQGLSGAKTPRALSLKLRRGEILGLFGLIGAGRTETLRCLLGLDATQAGQITIDGKHSPSNPAARMRAGLGLVSEDRKTEGLAQQMSIADNLTLSSLERYSLQASCVWGNAIRQ